jgi:hypothetical protein
MRLIEKPKKIMKSHNAFLNQYDLKYFNANKKERKGKNTYPILNKKY